MTGSEGGVMRDDLLNQLVYRLRPEPSQDDDYDIVCPHCGKEPKRGQKHAHMNEHGYYCFICRGGGGLADLLAMLEGKPVWTVPSQWLGRRAAKPVPQRERNWQEEAMALIQSYRRPSDLVDRWQAYKPISADSIARYSLGFGRLPGQMRQRLIVPIFQDGAVVALHGRDVSGDPDAPKWICAAGSLRLAWGLEELGTGSEIWIGENFVDRLLMLERLGHRYTCMALGGVRLLYAEEIDALRAARPKRIVICLDNDLVGQPSARLRTQLEEEWRQNHPDAKKIPDAFGPRICNQLRALNLPAFLFPWPNYAPPKADIGWVLATGGRS
jgi:hypothetical protein